MSALEPGLPPGWTLATLGEIGEYRNGRAFKESDWSRSGMPIIRIQDLTGSRANPNYFEGEAKPDHQIVAGNLLVSWVATLGAYIWRGPKAVLNQHIFKVQSRVDRAFHFYALTRVLEELRRKSHGSGMVHVTKSRFEQTQLPLPPRPEQIRIVQSLDDHFSRLDEAEAGLERVQRNLKRYRASVLQAAVTGRLVPTEAELARAEGRTYEPAAELLQRILAERRRKWQESGKRGTYQEPAPPDTANLPGLPEGWCWASVESIATKVVDGVHKKPTYQSSGVPFVTVRNLTAGPGLSFERLNYVSEEDHQEFSRRADPAYGDILVTKDGTLGVIRAVRTREIFSIFVSVALIKPVDRGMSDYLELALSSPPVQAQMVPKGSGLHHIHLEDLRADCVPVPPLAEQYRIVQEASGQLSIADELSDAISENLKRSARLRQSILKWAFEGKLVDQDPNDEPAEIELERIRTRVERLESEPTSGRRRGRSGPAARSKPRRLS